MSTRAPFKHFDKYEHFLSKKIAYNSTNTSYVIGKNTIVENGEPDIFWQDFVLIHDIGQIWNRGRFYNYNQTYKSLARMAKNTFEPFGGVLVTFLEEDGRKAFLNNNGTFDTLQRHGITPSLSIVPKFIDDNQGVNTDGTTYPVMSMSDIYRLMDDYGCDIVNHTYSNDINQYNSSDPYSTITNDLSKAEDWFVSRGIFTNCLSYPDGFYASDSNTLNAISKFEEYAISDSVDTYYNHDSTVPYDICKLKLSNSTVDYVIDRINLATGKRSDVWIILSTHSCFSSSAEDTGSANIYGELTSDTINRVIEAINTRVSNRGISMRYCTISEGLKIRAMESIGGTLFIQKSNSNSSIAEMVTKVIIKDDEITAKKVSSTNASTENLTIWNSADIRGPINISNDIAVSTTAANSLSSSITPKIDFSYLSESFKNDMMNYIMSNWGTIS